MLKTEKGDLDTFRENRCNEQFVQPVGLLLQFARIHARHAGNYLDAADFVGSRLTVTNANELNGHTFATPNHPRRSVKCRAECHEREEHEHAAREVGSRLAGRETLETGKRRAPGRRAMPGGALALLRLLFFSFRPASTGGQPGGRCGGEASSTRRLVNLGSLFYPYPRRATLSSSPIYKSLRKSVKKS